MRTTRRLAAFTLVELLVVIGIIAALIGILLPVLSGVASRGRDVQCQSNIRQCVQLFLTYAAENKGQLPFGFYYVKSDPVTWDDAAGDGRLVTLWSVISRMSSKKYAGDDVFTNPDAVNNSAPFLRCPEAMQVLPHLCSYTGNFVAFIDPFDDLRNGATATGTPGSHCNVITQPTRTTKLLPFTALMWDTAVQQGMAQDVGYVTGADIDGQRFWRGAGSPQYRYYSINDPFGQVSPIYGNEKPVVLNVGSTFWRNVDPAGSGSFGFDPTGFPWQGNLRFRHNKSSACNVGFADGHVGQFTGKFRSDGAAIKHDALRKNFMVKWPTGVGPDPGLPF